MPRKATTVFAEYPGHDTLPEFGAAAHRLRLRKCVEHTRYLIEQCLLFAEGRPDAAESARWNAARNTLLVVDRALE